MRDYIFGMEAEQYNNSTGGDFVVNRGQGGGNNGGNNPYDKAYLGHPSNRARINQVGKITSIPSPYARMHLTDLAFEELNCGIGILDSQERRSLMQTIDPDYKRALSHCLDMFELMYHASEFNFTQMGITLHKLNLLSTETLDPEEQKVLFDINGKLTQVGRYIKTLDLYRNSYLGALQKRGGNNTKFDFKSLYIFKYKGKVFAATSPFTGFFTNADCDLSSANITIHGKQLFSNDPATWRDCSQRDNEFIEFMYLLLKDYNLDKTFGNLFKAIEDVINQDNNWKTQIANKRFAHNANYEKFNMATAGLQQIPGTNVFIRPNGLDCSYLKFLLYLQNPVDLTIADAEYQLPMNQRMFNNEFLQWLGVNDILADALFVLPYDVNENYKVIPYKDATRGNAECRRCLVPIKSEALKYFKLDELINNINIVRNEQELFTVELTVNLNGGNTVVLRREYHQNPTLAAFPNGRLVQGSTMKPFAFGVYPFVKSSSALNIYKVLFYNVFDGDYRLNFYREDNGKFEQLLPNGEHLVNKANDTKDLNAPINCEYHHLQHRAGFEFAELYVEDKYSALIIPCLRTLPQQPMRVNVSIDLGTSNTYIAYNVQNPMNPNAIDIREINTNHVTNNVSWNELTFMNLRCVDRDFPDGVNYNNNSDDLIVRLSDDPNSSASSEMLDHQLCEFIPSRIDSTDNGSYKFPIPSVLNFLRVNTKRLPSTNLPDSNPLINTAIPFAYYERGMRQDANYYYDLIAKGNDFKWYKTRDTRGNIVQKAGGEKAFDAFIRELLFIVRCHLISQGFDLSQVNVYWSYPLSFDSALLSDYIAKWDKAFQDIIDRNSAGRLHYTCESRSPIYDCINPINARQMTVLVDIGGGSTDVIAYKNYQPIFVSSSKFAGNALYLCSDLNNSNISTPNTLMYQYVAQMSVMQGKTRRNGGIETKTISLNDDMATIMNYGFAKYPYQFCEIFKNKPAEFMLKLHNAALMYHIAQLCYAKSPDEAPCDIYLTGNGSKQLQMNGDYQSMIRKVFAYIYSKTDGMAHACGGINIQFPANPKAATAKGTLKGINTGIALDQAAISDNYVAFGDGVNILPNLNMFGSQLTPNCNVNNVFANVRDFVNMFYSVIYPIPMPSVSKADMLAAVDICERTIQVGTSIYDSLFLQVIAEVMERLSYQLANNN